MQPALDLPEGFIDILQEFTVSVLRTKPVDIVSYAADYFTKLKQSTSVTDPMKGGDRNKMGNPTCGHSPLVVLRGKSSKEEDDRKKNIHVSLTPKKSSCCDSLISDIFSTSEISRAECSMKLKNRRPSIAAETFDPEAFDDEEDEEISIVFPKTDQQRAMLLNVCQNLILFKQMDDEEISQAMDVMFEKNVKEGEKVIEQGTFGDNFYVIESGNYDVYIKDENGVDKIVSEYNGSGFFGELSLMYNAPRSATVVAKTPGHLWCMDRANFRRLVLSRAAKQRRMFIKLLHSVRMLQELSPYERMALADALVKRTCYDGECIIREGDPGAEMFFVMEGKVIVKNMQDGVETTLNELKIGEYFGELALLSSQNRAASVYSVGRSVIAVLGVDSFERLLGPCMDLLRRNMESYGEESYGIEAGKERA